MGQIRGKARYFGSKSAPRARLLCWVRDRQHPALTPRIALGYLGYAHEVSQLDDPETERIHALLRAVELGRASEAEFVEIELYLESRPELRSRFVRAKRDANLGEGWLARIDADRESRALLESPKLRKERNLALAAVLAGAALAVAQPSLGIFAMTLAGVWLLWALVRTQLQTHRRDPYKDIEQ